MDSFSLTSIQNKILRGNFTKIIILCRVPSKNGINLIMMTPIYLSKKQMDCEDLIFDDIHMCIVERNSIYLRWQKKFKCQCKLTLQV